MGDDYISIQELTRRTGIPERTLRRYIDRHKYFFTIRKEGGVNYITPEAAAVAGKIRAAYDDGLTAAMVDEMLKRQGAPVTVEDTDTGRSVTMTAADAMLELRRSITMPMLSMADQQEEIMETLSILADELRAERETAKELRDALAATQSEMAALRQEVRGMAAVREPGGRGRDKEQAKERAEILRELKATREALAAAEARGRRQEQQMSEIAEYVRAKPQEPARRRGWWPWAKR